MIHETASVSTDAHVGEGTRVWHQVQIREGAVIGVDCIIGKDVYIDRGVIIGDRVKIQNRVSLFVGVTIEDNVYIGPHVTFTNDRYPRAVNADGTPKSEDDWRLEHTLVREGASIGAGAIILPGITIDRWAMIGAGAVVTHGVPEQGLVTGIPARIVGYVCTCGHSLQDSGDTWQCATCGKSYNLGTVTADHP